MDWCQELPSCRAQALNFFLRPSSRTSRKIPRLPHLAHSAPVMQATMTERTANVIKPPKPSPLPSHADGQDCFLRLDSGNEIEVWRENFDHVVSLRVRRLRRERKDCADDESFT